MAETQLKQLSEPDLHEMKRLVTAWRELHLSMEDRGNIGKMREFDRAGRELYLWLYHNADAMIAKLEKPAEI
ncbi:hypothetical protein UFOVP399_23 [uncultured Caudovirales phage]|uniref:Uncharacterized protein n=1 Tax=uncultured Caudovirales phage TaxID=2100421 RepID=A0A6J5M2E5_9CAUD|nr:hypothetical protein UFOVP399_23 [uncultured Caudovirales phage]